MADLVWVSLTEAASPAQLRRVRVTDSGQAVAAYSRALWPQLEWAIRQRGKWGFFLKLEEVLWPPSLVRAIRELQPSGVHWQYHPEFWPGRTIFGGDFTRVTRELRRKMPSMRQWVTLHAPPPKRWWGGERWSQFDGLYSLGPMELPGGLRPEVLSFVPGASAPESGAQSSGPDAGRLAVVDGMGSVPGVRGTVSRTPQPRSERAVGEGAAQGHSEAIPGVGPLAEKLAATYF